MGRMLTVIKDGETLVISGGRVSIRPKAGKFATLIIDPSPEAQIKKVGAVKSQGEKQARG